MHISIANTRQAVLGPGLSHGCEPLRRGRRPGISGGNSAALVTPEDTPAALSEYRLQTGEAQLQRQHTLLLCASPEACSVLDLTMPRTAHQEKTLMLRAGGGGDSGQEGWTATQASDLHSCLGWDQARPASS